MSSRRRPSACDVHYRQTLVLRFDRGSPTHCTNWQRGHAYGCIQFVSAYREASNCRRRVDNVSRVLTSCNKNSRYGVCCVCVEAQRSGFGRSKHILSIMNICHAFRRCLQYVVNNASRDKGFSNYVFASAFDQVDRSGFLICAHIA